MLAAVARIASRVVGSLVFLTGLVGIVLLRTPFPLTAAAAVDTVVTELCVFQRRNGSLCLTELLDGATVDDVAAVTTARFAVDDAVTLRA